MLIVPYPCHLLLRDNPRLRQVVRSKHFKDMLRGLNRKGEIPEVQEMVREMRQIKEDLKAKLEALREERSMAITTNAWTNIRISTYIFVKLMLITDEWETCAFFPICT